MTRVLARPLRAGGRLKLNEELRGDIDLYLRLLLNSYNEHCVKLDHKDCGEIANLIKFLRDNYKKQQNELLDVMKKKEKILNEIKKADKLLLDTKQEHSHLKYGKVPTKEGAKLTKEQLENMQSTLMPITWRLLKRIGKIDMTNIILIREKLLYDKINQFNDSLKHNDRKVFKNLRAENEEIRSYLMNKDKTYMELMDAHDTINLLRRETKALNDMCDEKDSEIEHLKKEIKRLEKKVAREFLRRTQGGAIV